MISPSLHAYNKREKNNYFLGFKLDRNKRRERERERTTTVSTVNETNHKKVYMCVCMCGFVPVSACSLLIHNMNAKLR